MGRIRLGFYRLAKALLYSKQGLVAAWGSESSFRQEIIAAVILTPVSFIISKSLTQVAVLLTVVLLVLIVELVNSAIETIVNMTGEYNEFSGRAKDLGSAAVFLALVLCLVVWGIVIWQNYFM